jgi:uncharacterized ion transporter superfamily protein YfcC
MSASSETAAVTAQAAPHKARWTFPTAYTILLGLIVFVAALTWIVPASEFDRVTNEALEREVPVPGTYSG